MRHPRRLVAAALLAGALLAYPAAASASTCGPTTEDCTRHFRHFALVASGLPAGFSDAFLLFELVAVDVQLLAIPMSLDVAASVAAGISLALCTQQCFTEHPEFPAIQLAIIGTSAISFAIAWWWRKFGAKLDGGPWVVAAAPTFSPPGGLVTVRW